MNPLALAKRAFLDINRLLQEGFDCDWRTCRIDGVRDTIRELAAYIRAHDPDWPFPDTKGEPDGPASNVGRDA